MAVGELSLSLSPLLAISHSRKHLGDVNAPHDTTSFLGGAVNRPLRQKMQETTLLGLLNQDFHFGPGTVTVYGRKPTPYGGLLPVVGRALI